MNPEDDPRWNDPDWYYYPKGEGSWHWIGDYDPNDPRNDDDDWAYLPELGHWVWIGEDDPPEEYQGKNEDGCFRLFENKRDLILKSCIVAIGLLFAILVFVL